MSQHSTISDICLVCWRELFWLEKITSYFRYFKRQLPKNSSEHIIKGNLYTVTMKLKAEAIN
jgi:hypothetical protein